MKSTLLILTHGCEYQIYKYFLIQISQYLIKLFINPKSLTYKWNDSWYMLV